METLTPETEKFIEDEDKLTDLFLNKYNDRSKVKDQLKKLYNQKIIHPPDRAGKYYFTYKNTGLQNHEYGSFLSFVFNTFKN